MWLAYACGSAFFAGITAILAKVGIKKIDSNLATAIRTIVVLIFAWIMVRLTGSYTPIGSIGTRTLIYLTLSGIATGASWLCYFRALQLGDVNKVTPIDKSSTYNSPSNELGIYANCCLLSIQKLCGYIFSSSFISLSNSKVE